MVDFYFSEKSRKKKILKLEFKGLFLRITSNNRFVYEIRIIRSLFFASRSFCLQHCEQQKKI